MESGVVVKALGHEWQLTSEEAATAASEGKRVYTCFRCAKTREESIPKLPISDSVESPELPSSDSGDGPKLPSSDSGDSSELPSPDPGDGPEQPTSDSGNISKEELKKNSAKLDAGISVKWKGNAIALKWTKIAGAEGYDIFAARSGKKLNKIPGQDGKKRKNIRFHNEDSRQKDFRKKRVLCPDKPMEICGGKKDIHRQQQDLLCSGKGQQKVHKYKGTETGEKEVHFEKGKERHYSGDSGKRVKEEKIAPQILRARSAV